MLTLIYSEVKYDLFYNFRSAQGFKESIISGEDKYYQYCNKAFGTWDYALSDGKNVTLKKKSILKEIIVS